MSIYNSLIAVLSGFDDFYALTIFKCMIENVWGAHNAHLNSTPGATKLVALVNMRAPAPKAKVDAPVRLDRPDILLKTAMEMAQTERSQELNWV